MVAVAVVLPPEVTTLPTDVVTPAGALRTVMVAAPENPPAPVTDTLTFVDWPCWTEPDVGLIEMEMEGLGAVEEPPQAPAHAATARRVRSEPTRRRTMESNRAFVVECERKGAARNTRAKGGKGTVGHVRKRR